MVTTTLRLQAPGLRDLVSLWLRARQDPQDVRAKIRLRLLEKEGVHLCPRCTAPLSIEGYAVTKTAYSKKEHLDCGHCHTQFVLKSREVA